jgi:hypothetical protein
VVGGRRRPNRVRLREIGRMVGGGTAWWWAEAATTLLGGDRRCLVGEEGGKEFGGETNVGGNENLGEFKRCYL